MAQGQPIGLESTRAAALSRRLFVAGASAAVFVSGSWSRVASADGVSKKGPKRATCVAITDNGEQAVTSDDNGDVKLRPVPFDIRKKPESAKKKHQHKASFVAVVGRKAVTAGYDGLVIVHNLDDLGAEKPPFLETHAVGNAKPEAWVATLASDGHTVLVGTNDGQMMRWDSRDLDPRHVRRFRYSREPVAGLAFVPGTNDEFFLSTHAGEINLWKTSDLFEPVNTYSHRNQERVNAVAVSKDGNTFASASFDKSVRVWQVHKTHVVDPKPLQVLKGHKNIVWRVAIASDPASGAAVRVASAGEDAVRAWRLSDGEQATRIDPGKYGSMGVAFRGLDEVVFTRDGSDVNKPVDVGTLQFTK
jgi:WD40 repeat protein